MAALIKAISVRRGRDPFAAQAAWRNRDRAATGRPPRPPAATPAAVRGGRRPKTGRGAIGSRRPRILWPAPRPGRRPPDGRASGNGHRRAPAAGRWTRSARTGRRVPAASSSGRGARATRSAAPLGAGRSGTGPAHRPDEGTRRAEKTARPSARTTWRPTVKPGIRRAVSAASSKASPVTIRLALVSIPARQARRRARLTSSDRPKSSAPRMRNDGRPRCGGKRGVGWSNMVGDPMTSQAVGS